MIIKGRPRKDGHAMALYFMTSEDGARRIYGTDPMGDTVTAMTEWDEIGRLTRGEKPLYHLQLCPDAKYPVTDAQFKRMAEIVMEEVGAKGLDWELYFHPGLKDDGHHQPHAHLGICRTDRATLKMLELSYNYAAHERASKRIALEFGWDLVPGKHEKRDRAKQEEFPRQKLTKDEAEYEKRTGLSKEDRVRQIMALKAACDSGVALKAALEQAGYILAKGDRGYIVVDRKGGQSVLSRNTGLKKKDLEAFMKGVDLDRLPTIEEAKAQQKLKNVRIWDGEEKAPERAAEKGVEASKFLQGPEPLKAPEAPAAPEDPEIERIKKAVADRQAAELQKWHDWHAQELRQLEFDLDREQANKLVLRHADELKELAALKETIRDRTSGLKGFMEAMENRWNPQLGAERARQRRREIAQLKRRQEKERADYLALIEQTKQLEIENLKERQAQRLRDQRQLHIDEEARYIRDHEEAKRLAEQIEAEARERERNESLRDGPPPPKLGK